MGNEQSIQSQRVGGFQHTNFYHICNITPDIPTCQHILWVNDNEMNDDDVNDGNDDELDELQEQNQKTLPFLDRRFDLDVAPSMLNMNLEWNGAYMVAIAMYNAIFHKYGQKFLISTQALHWKTLKRIYKMNQYPNPESHYTASLSSLLETAKLENICSEKDFSIYTEYAQLVQKADEMAQKDNQHGLPPSIFPSVSDGSFYRMRYYYLPFDKTHICRALQQNAIILANIAIFTNFLKFRKGMIEPPTDSDECVGMLAILILGYQNDTWIVRFPFGRTWGDTGVGYIAFDYFDRYCRDRWVIDVDQFRRPDEDADASTLGLFCTTNEKTTTPLLQQQKKTTNRSAQQHRRRMF